jgi:hypothetical protein
MVHFSEPYVRCISGFEFINETFVLVVTVGPVAAGSASKVRDAVPIPAVKQRPSGNDPCKSGVLVFRKDVVGLAQQLLLKPVAHAFVKPIAIFQYFGCPQAELIGPDPRFRELRHGSSSKRPTNAPALVDNAVRKA